MADSSFTSSRFPESEASLSKNIQLALAEIRSFFPHQKIPVLQYEENLVAIPFELMINLPSRGPVNEVDVRRTEPIFLLLDKRYYPYKAPTAWSNRTDFPKNRLPHLNPKRPGSPANFCLHRGSIDTWFSEHDIIDYIDRVRDWLTDAASNRLIKEDGFEFTRIDQATGICIFERSQILNKIVNEWKSKGGNSGFCYLRYVLLNNPEKDPLVGNRTDYAIRLEKIPTNGSIAADLKDAQTRIANFHEGLKSDRYFFGILAWPSKDSVHPKYFAELPDTLADLITLSEELGIPLKEAINTFLSKNLQLFGGIPVTIVIPRPQKIIYTDSHLELLNFVISFKTGGNKLPENSKLDERVMNMSHRSPITLARAREISSMPHGYDMGKILLLGCGAIGSKFAIHLIKNGQCKKITFVDNDELSPHNLIRHGLLHDYLGMNKAQALKRVTEEIFYAEKDSINATAIQENALDLIVGKDNKILCNHTLLIDATASPTIRNALVSCKNLPSSLSVCRCEIADNGNLGFMSIEGPKRNPRLDDILYYLFDSAIDDPEISDWLKATEKQRNSNSDATLEEINIGISCNSDTMRLSDDIVSLHSSSFSLGSRKIIRENKQMKSGYLQISYINKESGNHSVRLFEISPIVRIPCENNPKWDVRVKEEVKQSIMQCARDSGRNEIGGLLFGHIEQKNKVVYVMRFLPAPPDSICEPHRFVRGVKGVREKISEIGNLTGGLINYIGEWHSHPNGVKKMSGTDWQEIKNIKTVLDPVPLSTFMMIVTKEGLHPYMFDSNGGK